ncbi:HyaD/HybD family hydrogenase maturation endopeptidase [Chloroflexota bacterium]
MSFVDHEAIEKSPNPTDTTRTVVLGVGNLLLKDEGVGIHVINALQDSLLPPSAEVEIIDGGTSPNVLPLLDGAEKLIIIDAVEGGGEPGTIYRFRAGDVELEDKCVLSMHQIGLLEDLEMMEHMEGKQRDAIIIGVEPKEMGVGLELSSELEQKIPQIVKVVLKEITEEARKC